MTSKPIIKLIVKPEQVLMPQKPQDFDVANLTVITARLAGITRFSGIPLEGNEAMMVNFTIKFPANAGSRDAFLSFRQLAQGKHLGQMNYEFRIRAEQIL